MADFLTSVAKLGRREFDPLRLPISIGGLASGDSLFLSTSLRMLGLSGVSNILEFSILHIEASALVLSVIRATKTTPITILNFSACKRRTLYRLRRVHWPIWLRLIVNFPRTNTLTGGQCASFNSRPNANFAGDCLEVDSTFHELMTGQKESNLNRFIQGRLHVVLKC